MMTSPVALFAAALLSCTLAGPALAAAPAQADPQADPQAYAGQYALADGRILTFGADAGVLTAQLGKPGLALRNARFSAPRTVVLKPAGPGRFIGATAPLQLTFAADGHGDVAQVSLSERDTRTQGLARR